MHILEHGAQKYMYMYMQSVSLLWTLILSPIMALPRCQAFQIEFRMTNGYPDRNDFAYGTEN